MQGVVLHGVLDDQDRADGGDAEVAVDVLAVLDQLHDREQHVGAAAPGEGAVDPFRLGAAIGLVEPGPVEDDHHDGQAGLRGLHLAAELGRVHVRQVAGDQDQVEVLLRQDAESLLGRRGR